MIGEHVGSFGCQTRVRFAASAAAAWLCVETGVNRRMPWLPGEIPSSTAFALSGRERIIETFGRKFVRGLLGRGCSVNI